MLNVVQSRYLVLSFLFCHKKEFRTDPCSACQKSHANLNLLVSFGYILLCQLWECETREACSILSKHPMFMFDSEFLFLFSGVDLCEVVTIAFY